MTKLTTEEKQHRELYKRLYGVVKYKHKPSSGQRTVTGGLRDDHEAVVETRDGKRRLVLLVGFPSDLSVTTYGKRVFVKCADDNVFREAPSEAIYSMPAGVVRVREVPEDFRPTEGISIK